MRQTSAGAIPQLVRSHPTLTGATLSANCAATDLPFLDETNSSGGVVGTVMTLGAIESLQFRYVVDPAGTDDPTQFTVLNSISVCDTASASSLREVRLQIVSRATSPDRDTNGAALNNYATPGFEGVSPSSAVQDAYPRRAFVMSVVPRTLQRERL